MQMMRDVRSKPGRNGGASLLIVLAVVSVLSLLVLAFFLAAKHEYAVSSSKDWGRRAVNAEDQVINLVINQIRRATAGPARAWASQPGVIRTWDADGNFHEGYKLYSDESLVARDERNLVETDYRELAEWASRPWMYVDLNEAVIRGKRAHFPIADSTARDLPARPDPNEGDEGGIEGFDYSLEGIQRGPTDRALAALEIEPLPMPAKWIYQLKDGTLGVLNEAREFVPLIGSERPTRKNPMVMRMAFWADDETCKLNPNVHAGGLTWTTPKAGGDFDRLLNRYTPAKNEWQRYPGHPATTHLSPVLAPGRQTFHFLSQGDALEKIYQLVPRVVGGGSRSGTRHINFRNPLENKGLIPDRDRLYASIDDLVLRPDRKANEFPDPAHPGETLGNTEASEHLERSRFFLSAVSRAPEETLFNTPRVSLWPTHFHEGDSRAPQHTPHDRLLRFCAETGVRTSGSQERIGYHFQRRNADSPTADFEEISRNRELYAYLDRLTRERVPGFGASFSGKYEDGERFQILTEILDAIRSTNLHDDNVYGEDWKAAFSGKEENPATHRTFTNGRIEPKTEAAGVDWNDGFKGSYIYAEKYWNAIPRIHKGHGQVTPLSIEYQGKQTKGIGRFFTLQNLAVHVIACGDGGDGSEGGGWQPANPGTFEYGKGFTEEPSGERYSNFPPLPQSVRREDQATWPDWLKALEPEWVDRAFDPANWNWQLAWLDPQYRDTMPEAKFDRNALGDAGVTRLGTGEKAVQAALIWTLFSPSLGWTPVNPDLILDFQIDGMNFIDADGEEIRIGWRNLPQFGSGGPGLTSWGSSRNGFASFDYLIGGVKLPAFFQSAGRELAGERRFEFPDHEDGSVLGVFTVGRKAPLDLGFSDTRHYHRYSYVTRPFKVKDDVEMQAGRVAVRIFSAGGKTGTGEGGGRGNDLTELTGSRVIAPELVQTLEVPFDRFEVPAPDLAPGRPANPDLGSYGPFGKLGPMHYWSLSWDGPNPLHASTGRMAISGAPSPGSLRRRSDHEPATRFSEFDVVQSVGIAHGDARMVAAKPLVRESDDLFRSHRHYGTRRMAHTFSGLSGVPFAGKDETKSGELVPGIRHHPRKILVMPAADAEQVQRYGDFDSAFASIPNGPYISRPDEGNRHFLVNRSYTSFPPANVTPWGEQWVRDGRPYHARPSYWLLQWVQTGLVVPAYHTPNRIISSAAMFGSLPVGSTTNQPWRTLLFRPNVSGHRYDSHPGAGSSGQLPDHLLLDLFWMPVVEPYAISENFSTSGKVNLNQQILPFRHIRRDTALRGVFKSETLLCVPNQMVIDAKVGLGRGRGYHWRDNPYGGVLQTKSLRAAILDDETLAQFEERFNHPERPTIFRSASEICDVHLVPEDWMRHLAPDRVSERTDIGTYTPTVDEMANGKYWSDHATVGDNARERPYANIYARVTTKSNTYKVHYRTQTLQQGTRSDPEAGYETWDPMLDEKVSESRGSAIIERYLDPGDSNIPDYATTPDAAPLGKFYQYRVINPSRFTP